MPTATGVLNVDGEVKVHRHDKVLMTVHPAAFEFYVPVNLGGAGANAV